MAKRWFGRQRRFGSGGSGSAVARRISRPAARRIVRKAGPQDKSWFYDSSLILIGGDDLERHPSVYSGATVESHQHHNLLTASSDIFNGSVSHRERALISSFRVLLRMRAIPSNTLFTTFSHMHFCLWVGTPDDLTDDVAGQDLTNWGSQANLVAYQDKGRGVRMLCSKTVSICHPPVPVGTTGSDPDVRGVNNIGMQSHRWLTLRVRKPFWMNETEIVRMSIRSHKHATLGSETSWAGVSGWHNVRALIKRF